MTNVKLLAKVSSVIALVAGIGFGMNQLIEVQSKVESRRQVRNSSSVTGERRLELNVDSHVAQDLKSKPQGNRFLKLNGTFDVPSETLVGKSVAISMILADLNGDGINELITGRENGISVQMGDINAFAPQTQAAWEAIRDLRFLSPFKPDSRSIELPIRADIILSGDFDRNSKLDIAVAAIGGNSIYLIEGDGIGGYRNIKETQLAGQITSLASGDVNRLDGLPDIIAGLDTNGVYSLSIYQGLGDIFNSEPENVELHSPATQILVGQFNENTFADIAVTSGGELVIFSGSDRDSEKAEPLILGQGLGIKGIAAGDFIPDRDYRTELALLGADGFIHILSRGDLDTRPITKQELMGVEAHEKMQKGMPIPQRIMRTISKSDLREKPESNSTDAANWSQADSFYGAANGEALSGGVLLSSARLSNRAGDDLILMDQAHKSLQVLPLIVNEDGEKGVEMSYVGKRVPVKFDLDGTPIAITAERLNFDGSKDLIILEAGKTTPTTLMSAPEAAFTVNNNGDQVDANPGNGTCATAGGVCTLRAAIMEANHLPGTDSITINAGLNITLSTGSPDNDANGVFNFEGGGDLDITCAVNAGGDSCNLPLATNVNNLTITGAAGGNTIAVGTFTPFAPLTSTTDRVFDIGFDGLFGGGFGAGTGLLVTMSNLTIQSGNVREDFNAGGGGFGNFARGGAIRLDGFGQGGTRGTLTLTSVTINNNQADHNSGGIFNQFSNVSISSSTVSNNIGKAGPGGGLQFAASTPATLVVSGSSFTGNEARTGPIFMGTAIDVDGGGIYATLDNNTAMITSTNFTNNISHDDGGAIYVASGATTVSGGTISGNTARDDGGAIAGDNDTVSALRFMTLSGATIQSNTANSDASGGGDGGGVFRDRGTLNLTNCTTGGLVAGQPNNARNGGGIAHAFRAAVTPSNQTTINIDNGSITGNNATTDGGGVFINATNQNVGTPSVLNVGSTTNVAVTENNSNVHGGGFAISGNVTASVTRATIHGNDADKDNNATGDGGGIYHNNSGGTLTIPATVSIGTGGQGNTGENGGAIHHSVGTLNLTGTGIASNTTDIHGGGLFVSGGIVNVNGVTFAANTSTSGTEVRLTGGTTNFTGTVTIPGELSIAGGTLSAGSSTVNLGEDFHFSSGTFTAGTSTFNFNGSGAQQIYGGAVPTFNTLTVANTAAQFAVNNNANANGNLTINANAILNPAAASAIGGTGTLTGSGTVRVTRIAATADFLSQYTITNKTLTNLLVDYVGAGAQVLSGTTYGSLRINNASGVTLSGTATVNLTLTFTAGALSAGTGTLNINNGTSVGAGSITSAPTGTVVYGQTSNGQSVLAGTYGNLTFSNFNKTLPAGIVSMAGTFTPGSGTPTVTGNTINFNGTALQTVPTFNFNNLTNSNTIGLAMNNDTTVNGVLVLTGSDITVANTRTLTQPGSIASTGTFDVVGSVRRTGAPLPVATVLTFGNPNNQIMITAGTPPTDITVNLVKAVPSGGMPFPAAVQRTYTITPTGGSGLTSTLRLHYLDAELNGNIESGLGLWRFGTAWVRIGRTSNDATSNWVELTGITQLSAWTLSSNKNDTTTGLTSSQNPAPLGTNLTFTATVNAVQAGAGTLTGTVQFLDGVTPIAGCTAVAVAAGQAQCMTTALTVGNHTITAAYSGDTNFNTSNGNLTGNPQVITGPPTITPTVGLTRVQGNPATNSQIAVVSDDVAAPGAILVTAMTVPANMTITNIVNTNGTITADISAGCAAATGANVIVLKATDGKTLNMTANLSINVTANPTPTLGNYTGTTIVTGCKAIITPDAAPGDNQPLASVTVSAPGFGGMITVDPVTGIVTATNSGPVAPHTVTVTATDSCGLMTTKMFTLTVTAPPTAPTEFDFDGDRKADIAVYRGGATANDPSFWYLLRSSDGMFQAIQFGADSDVIVPGDYNGDGMTEVAIYRPSTNTWFTTTNPATNYGAFKWGIAGDIPVPGFYDNDNKTDIAVFRPSDGNWYIAKSTGGSEVRHWGQMGDKPIPADVDGDGFTDLVQYRETSFTFFIQKSGGGTVTQSWGQTGDKLVLADYDGDNKDDIAVFRPSNSFWYILQSTGGTRTVQWGLVGSGDVPVPADYDNDGKADLMVYRTSGATWHHFKSCPCTPQTTPFGIATDKPIPSAFTP